MHLFTNMSAYEAVTRKLQDGARHNLSNVVSKPWEEVTGGCGKLHSEELHNVHCPPHIVRVIKSKRMRWAGHVACLRETRNAYSVLVRDPEEKRPRGRLG